MLIVQLDFLFNRFSKEIGVDINMLKRNTAYSKGAVEYTQGGIRLKCSVAGTTDITDIVVDQPTITDGTVTWQLMDYAGIDYALDEKK